MSNRRKWVVAAVVLIGAGVLACGIACASKWLDVKRPRTRNLVANTYDVDEGFQNIAIDVDVDKIELILADDGTCKVVCTEEDDAPHNVLVEEDTLTIEANPKRTETRHVEILTGNPKIEVYLPKDRYGTLSVRDDTGGIDLPEDISFDTINVTLDTGDASCRASAAETIDIRTGAGTIAVVGISAGGLTLASDMGQIDVSDAVVSGEVNVREGAGAVALENVTCENLSAKGDTGSMIMTNVIASGTLRIEQDAGDIELKGCDAEEIHARTDTGSVRGTVLSDKVFVTKTETGSVSVPQTTGGGRCEITTGAGDISFEVDAGAK